MSKQSIPAWLKRNSGWGGPYEKLVEAAQLHAQTGDHPQIAFEGSTLEMVTAIYLEHAKKAGASDGLYCTWRHVADKMAKSLNLQPGDHLLIPGFGLGALYEAARRIQPQGMPITSVECQNWLVQVAEAAAIPVTKGDFLNGLSLPLQINKVLCNPPMGNLWGFSKVHLEFLERIAEKVAIGAPVAILLPGGPEEVFDKMPKKYDWLKAAFDIAEAELTPNAAAPKSITVTRYLLERR